MPKVNLAKRKQEFRMGNYDSCLENNSHYRSYRYKWETRQKRKLVGRMHRVGRVLSFIFSRQNCFFPTPHPQSNVSRAKGKRGGTHSLASEGVGVTERDSVFDEGIYTVVLYFYMYYVLIWAKRENRRWGWMIMIHVPRHHNIELIAKYRTVAESVLCEGCVVWRHAAHHTQIVQCLYAETVFGHVNEFFDACDACKRECVKF